MVIRYFAYIRSLTGTKELRDIDSVSVDELLGKLCALYGKAFEQKLFKDAALSDEIIILVNGRHIHHLDGLNTKLSETDEISIFPVVAGG